MKRWSVVQEMKINGITLASIFQIGDNTSIKPVSKAMAVQRQIASFNENEGNFADFPLFKREIPIPDAYEDVHMSVDNSGCDSIQVRYIRILAISSSSVVQVGSNCQIESETRIKHFRQFVK
ncbi:spore germination protein GerPE [Paenibacillus agricola]|uniref:Spore germination protein GerPE n=1 Tax=Paenibacillus agricola TaxID=2716264 RepID=A0ABX0IWL3_9BACL|nr:spore germination protein GerPE [Paenibacillus agricola]NHN28289.1 spore germination protein GerPE [Paenibacillus agricola]